MGFAGKVWRLLVGIKDGLVLIMLLLFFGVLFSVLTTRPSPGNVHEGALLLQLDGMLVEETSSPDPLSILMSGELPLEEYRARDLISAIDAAADDDRIKAVVLDLSRFTGGGQVHLQEIGNALDHVRQADKPVLAFALAYGDDAMMLASHASEIWVDPLGGALITGPGGKRLYYGKLLDQLKVNARVYRVGTYKSAVEPYLGSGMSPEARENASALYGSMWEEWQAHVKKARPAADIERVTKDTVTWMAESGGDSAKAALAAGLVDKLGDYAAFGARVAELVGEDTRSDQPGAFAHTELGPWLAANAPSSGGKAIGVVTIAGVISDGEEGPGSAGGDRIARLLDDALDDDLAALVVRVDSPGGTVTGSEAIRRAVLRHKDKGIPIIISMANVAASGGYWIATTGDQIFAEPETITGSIGIFGVLPTFERALSNWGVESDGVLTTPLSGQPDVFGGLTPEVDAVLQQTIEHGYGRFLSLVAKARGKTPAQIDAIAQGRVWDGGTARQIGLVDQFGDLDNALAWAAKQAKLEDGAWHAQFLGNKPDPYASMLQKLLRAEVRGTSSRQSDLLAFVGTGQQEMAGRIAADMDLLMGSKGVQAYCLECPARPATHNKKPDASTLALLAQLLGD